VRRSKNKAVKVIYVSADPDAKKYAELLSGSKRVICLTNAEIETLRQFYQMGMLFSDFSNHEEDVVVYKILQALGAQVDEPLPPNNET